MTDTTQTQTCSSPLTKLVDIITRVRGQPKPQPATTDSTDALGVLSSDRRLYLIEVLATHDLDGPVDLSTLSTRVAAMENDCRVSEVTSKQYNRVYISMQQQHAPKMDRQGYLEYSHDRKVVTPTPQLARVWEAYRAFRGELTG